MNNGRNPKYRKLIYVLIGLILLTPLGLLTTYTSWGEWSKEEIKKMIGYLPQGLNKLADIWTGVLPDYQHPSASSLFAQSIFYIISAVLGAVIIYALLTVLLKIVKQ